MQAPHVQGRAMHNSCLFLYSLLVMGSMKSSGSNFCVGSSGPSTPPPSAAAHNHKHTHTTPTTSQLCCHHQVDNHMVGTHMYLQHPYNTRSRIFLFEMSRHCFDTLGVGCKVAAASQQLLQAGRTCQQPGRVSGGLTVALAAILAEVFDGHHHCRLHSGPHLSS